MKKPTNSVYLIDTNIIWPLFWPTKLGVGEPCPLALDWWELFRTSPILLHASTYTAAAHFDTIYPSGALTRSAEALIHKTEAIRLINEKLSDIRVNGTLPDDGLYVSWNCKLDLLSPIYT
jgi:hypothetical protein